MHNKDDYHYQTSTFNIPPSNITMGFSNNCSITLSEGNVDWKGFENADDATKAFLERLKEIYPSFFK